MTLLIFKLLTCSILTFLNKNIFVFFLSSLLIVYFILLPLITLFLDTSQLLEEINFFYLDNTLNFILLYLIISFLFSYFIKYRQNYNDALNYNSLLKYYLFFGLLFLFFSGTLFHTSEFELPWKISLFSGPGFKFFSLGVSLGVIHFLNYKSKISFIIYSLVLLTLAIITGSRSIIIIGYIVGLFIYYYETIKKISIRTILIFLIIIFLIFLFVGLIGVTRTDYQTYNFYFIFNIALERLSDYQYIISVISKNIDNYVLYHFSDYLKVILPDILIDNSNTTSVFAKDTLLMKELGISKYRMSVPLTMIGEYFLYINDYSKIIIYILSLSIITHLIYLIYSKSKNNTIFLCFFLNIIMQFPLGTSIDQFSMITKDLVFYFLLINISFYLGKIKY